jgi:hypothetical protein
MPTPQYPDSFPIESIKAVIDAVKDGSAEGDVKVLAYHAWVVQGYAQKALVGEASSSDEITLLSAEDVDANQADALDALEAAVSDEPQAQVTLPWNIILPFLLNLIQKWLSKQTG